MNEPNQQYGPIDSVNLSQNNEHNPRHGYRMIIITVIVLMIAIVGIMVLRKPAVQQGENTATAPTQAVEEATVNPAQSVPVPASTIADRQLPWLEITAEGGSYTVGQEITLYVKGSSGGKDVTGYDMLFAFDRELFEVQSITSELPDYQIFQFDKGTHYTVTGIKDFNKKEAVMFDNSNIIKVMVKAKKQGTGLVSVIAQNGKEKTQLVDANVTVVQPQIGSLSLEIK